MWWLVSRASAGYVLVPRILHRRWWLSSTPRQTMIPCPFPPSSSDLRWQHGTFLNQLASSVRGEFGARLSTAATSGELGDWPLDVKR